MTEGSVLPDFLVCGAGKSGTTSLHSSLAAHPDVFLPETKEVDFFSQKWDNGLGWYRDRFRDADPDQVVGEASPSYMTRAEEAAPRVAKTLPDADLVFILRNPVDRAYSQYRWDLQRGRHKGIWEKDFAEVLDDPLGERYLRDGEYADRLHPFLDRFPDDQVHVILFEEYVADQDEVLDDLQSFLGLDVRTLRPSASNPTRTLRSRGVAALLHRLRRADWLGGLLDPGTFPEPVKRILRPIVYQDEGYPPMDPDLRRRLVDHYRPHNRRLAELLDRDLGVWDEVHESP